MRDLIPFYASAQHLLAKEPDLLRFVIGPVIGVDPEVKNARAKTVIQLVHDRLHLTRWLALEIKVNLDDTLVDVSHKDVDYIEFLLQLPCGRRPQVTADILLEAIDSRKDENSRWLKILDLLHQRCDPQMLTASFSFESFKKTVTATSWSAVLTLLRFLGLRPTSEWCGQPTSLLGERWAMAPRLRPLMNGFGLF